MTQADIAILEWLYNEPNEEIVASPSTISDNIDYAKPTVKQRCPVLRDQGLLDYHEKSRGVYALTDLARRYLTGDADREELEDLK
jgi:Mn-dependent DtxR family transcriptional regulator